MAHIMAPLLYGFQRESDTCLPMTTSITCWETSRRDTLHRKLKRPTECAANLTLKHRASDVQVNQTYIEDEEGDHSQKNIVNIVHIMQ